MTYAKLVASPRRAVANEIAALIRAENLTNPFGGDVEQSKDRKHYGILFAIPRYLDGLVQVFSPKFILIKCQGPLVHGEWSAVFTSPEAAKRFIRRAFVEHDFDGAAADPTDVKVKR